ncbi:alpha/beta hydrolase [Leeuwenhoekiella sp. A16]|uniref:alpha/beta hydrolase n=1 Tax=unclassified Leeuwenhoekiella TaxID=2615029 RepID=UPI003A7FDE5F
MHKYEIIEAGKPLEKAEKAIILLHGRGASAHDIIELASHFIDDSFYIAAPQATNSTWYPYSFLAPESQNEPWLTSAVNIVKNLLENIKNHLSSSKIYLMGFSQGACLTLEAAARFAQPFGGIAAFTGGLIGENVSVANYSGDFKNTPVFIGVGDKDMHVPLKRVEESKLILEKLNANVTLNVYPGRPHTILQDEIETVKKLMF